jgi:hypothetical protein
MRTIPRISSLDFILGYSQPSLRDFSARLDPCPSFRELRVPFERFSAAGEANAKAVGAPNSELRDIGQVEGSTACTEGKSGEANSR